MVLIGFEMQIGCVQVVGIEQHLLQEPDDRGVFDFSSRVVVNFGQLGGAGFIKLKLVTDDAVHRFRHRGGAARYQSQQLVVFSQHPVNAQLGGKLDFFDRLAVRRIGGGDDQPVVALTQNEDPVIDANPGVQQSLGQTLSVNLVQINQGCREGGRQGVRQINRGHHARAREFRDETGACALRLAVDALCLLLPNLAGQYQRAAQPRQDVAGSFGKREIDGGHSMECTTLGAHLARQRLSPVCQARSSVGDWCASGSARGKWRAIRGSGERRYDERFPHPDSRTFVPPGPR